MPPLMMNLLACGEALSRPASARRHTALRAPEWRGVLPWHGSADPDRPARSRMRASAASPCARYVESLQNRSVDAELTGNLQQFCRAGVTAMKKAMKRA
jgi:hypothetical protein